MIWDPFGPEFGRVGILMIFGQLRRFRAVMSPSSEGVRKSSWALELFSGAVLIEKHNDTLEDRHTKKADAAVHPPLAYNLASN